MKRFLFFLIFFCLIRLEFHAQTYYSVHQIPYRPQSYLRGYSLPAVYDDLFTEKLPIGFDFNFFEGIYDSVVVSANGILSFNNFPLHYSFWKIEGNSFILPNPDDSTLKKGILFPFQDLANFDGINSDSNLRISYYTDGIAPNRKFVVNFYEHNYFNCSDSCGLYRFTQIPYAPVPGSGIRLPVKNDTVTPNIPLGFNFNLSCDVYNSVSISSNGFLSFDNYASNVFEAPQSLPSHSSPNSIIAGAWTDLNPESGGYYEYFSQGISPYRIFVVNYVNVAFATDSTKRVTTQIVLHEWNNMIDIYTQSYPADMTQPATMGIEDAAGVSGFNAPGRNNSFWEFPVVNEGVRFIPGRAFTGQVVLHESTNNIDINIDKKSSCLSWNRGLAVEGIQDSLGLTAYVVPGRNDTTVWYAYEDAWRFCYNGNCSQPADSVDFICIGSISASVDRPSCLNDSSGSILLNLINISDSRDILWNDGDTTDMKSGLRAGIYNITVSDTNGCVYHSAITVPNAFTIPLRIISAKDTICRDSSIVLTALSIPDAFDFIWSNGDSARSITVHPAVSGTYSVTCRDSSGCIGRATKNVYLRDCRGLGISNPMEAGIQIYPNPAGESVTVVCEATKTTSIEIFDMSGRLLIEQAIHAKKEEVSLNLIPSGTYIISIRDEGGIYFRKILIRN